MWVFAILSVIAAAVIFYLLGRKHINIEREKENKYIQSLNLKLEQDCENRELKLKEINNQILLAQEAFQKKIEELTLKYKSKEAEFMLKESEMDYKLGDVKDLKFSRINEAATQYRQTLYDEILFEKEQRQIEFNQWREKLTLEILQLQTQVDELTDNREALIEANKREEEIRLQQDFYKIVLTKDNLEDIKLLKSIEKFLFNKDPLYKLIWNTFYMIPTKDMLNRVIGKEKTSGIIDLEYRTFTYKRKKYTQLELIDKVVEYIKYL